MKIYVAGKWEEKERVREVQRQLIANGHTITFDWTKATDGDLEHIKAQAISDRHGVLNADAYVGVFEKDLRYSGALVEMGMAFAINIPVYVLGHAVDNNVFVRGFGVRRGLDGLCGQGQRRAQEI